MQTGFSTTTLIITLLAIIAGLVIEGSFYVRNLNRQRPIQVVTPHPTRQGVKGVTVFQSASPVPIVTLPPRPVPTASSTYSSSYPSVT